MKRALALFGAALLAAFCLTACGQDQKNDSNSTNDTVLSGTGEKENTHGDGLMGDMVQGTEDLAEDAKNGVEDAAEGVEKGVDDLTDTAENAGNAMKRSVENGGVSYGEMLDNARVHDTDGNLNDRENAVTPGWDG